MSPLCPILFSTTHAEIRIYQQRFSNIASDQNQGSEMYFINYYGCRYQEIILVKGILRLFGIQTFKTAM